MGAFWVGEVDVARLAVGQVGGWNAAEPARLVVLESLDDLGPGVHDERAVVHDRLANRPAAENQDLQVRVAALLMRVSPDAQDITGTEHHQLVIAGGAPLGACGPAP